MPKKSESQPTSNLPRQNPIWEVIPQELKALPQWVCWKAIQRNGKITKPPINPHTLEEAQTDNPTT
jgi:putative DNA primase/helicase